MYTRLLSHSNTKKQIVWPSFKTLIDHTGEQNRSYISNPARKVRRDFASRHTLWGTDQGLPHLNEFRTVKWQELFDFPETSLNQMRQLLDQPEWVV
jgi:hypothetical protein